ncbi:MAG: flagellar basal-body rod protein FlgB [Paracoccaceae bacterium]|jgi:flagellar basal-body rod protein FlgB
MDLSNLKLFQMASKRMDWLSKRQQVLSQNIANSDTPGYGPKDLKQLNFQEMLRPQLKRSTLQKTSSMHIEAMRKDPKYRNDSKKDVYETAPGGNSVILEEQLTKVSETQANHRLASNIYSKQLAMIKIALGRPGR